MGTGQYFDEFAYMINDTTSEGLQIQEVEIYKATGYDRWKIVDPFKNRAAIETVWAENPNVQLLDDYSREWMFYLRTDGEHLTWWGNICPGMEYEDGYNKEIIYRVPSSYYAPLIDLDDNIVYDKTDGIFKLNPLVAVENSGYFGQYLVWVGLPGVDLASFILPE